ncbi:MAG TPA: hypothetical protein PLA54_11280 [Spirochaetota bacterium]|nr:hypothetical protein [Spirochaetota bacterium]
MSEKIQPRAAVEELKRKWLIQNQSFNILEIQGFDDYHEELKHFQDYHETEKMYSNLKKAIDLHHTLNGNPIRIAEKFVELEKNFETLKSRLRVAETNIECLKKQNMKEAV